jgi:CRP-like cAMP-binding protein
VGKSGKVASTTEDARETARISVPRASASFALSLRRFFERNGILIRLSRHQEQPLDPAAQAQSYMLRSGILAVETRIPARHIIGFRHAGDLLETDALTPLPGFALRAIDACELWRLPQSVLRAAMKEQPDLAWTYMKLSSATVAKLVIHDVVIGRLTGLERLATFLIAFATQLGAAPGSRADLTLPMSRSDIADHLSLNPDTLSRLMTELQSAGLIELRGPRHVIIKDWDALCEASPISCAVLLD